MENMHEEKYGLPTNSDINPVGQRPRRKNLPEGLPVPAQLRAEPAASVDLESYMESLAGDISSLLAAEEKAALLASARELREAESARICLADYLRGQVGGVVELTTREGQASELRIVEVAQTWLLGEGYQRRVLVPVSAIMRVRQGSARRGRQRNERVDMRELGIAMRLEINAPLRALARKNRRVYITHEAGRFSGQIRHVGRDWLEIRDSAAPTGPQILALSGLIRIETNK
ncbi:hypothetical protein ACU19_06875 [Actinobaculum suis]|uniref:hypothetical protein n=1 Tax=Actinobaculum suis TaxID=1657 RepID=UPI00066FBB3E|nr:hypothetical protein [Actinobaculum suis]KMY22983.1 hypothetical protein ACU19_06875 [Actinobaculum suis]